MKLGVQPDRVLQSMLNDRMVAKGLILQYATTFFQDYLSSESIDDLVALLRKARLDTHLLDLFPPQKRTLTDLDEHFKVGRSSAPRCLPESQVLAEHGPCRAWRIQRERLRQHQQPNGNKDKRVCRGCFATRLLLAEYARPSTASIDVAPGTGSCSSLGY